ncbi:iron-containing alcohol dehydrogenase [candidate division KSB1 bacterium]|nr:iron-containing alcohol dehydrogenase [candidate division KSB1 bacterium]
MRFEFGTASRIVFGQGTVKEVPQLLIEKGQRVLFITGTHLERSAPLLELLKRTKFEISVYSVSSEPTVNVVSAGVRFARGNEWGGFVWIGGGGGNVLAKKKTPLITKKWGGFFFLVVY